MSWKLRFPGYFMFKSREVKDGNTILLEHDIVVMYQVEKADMS